MVMPSIFGESLIDEFEKDFFRNENRSSNLRGLMRTDVKENDDSYELDIDLPGFKKEDIKISCENGYMNIAATTNTNNDVNISNNKYIRQERFYGTMSRSFYIGENISKDDIKARFENGVLKLTVPKQNQKVVEQNNYIEIE